MKHIPLFKSPIPDHIHLKLEGVFASGQLAAGKEVADFEGELEKELVLSNVVATSDMTTAMMIALKLAGVSKDDEVIIAPFTCLASSSAILNVGANAVWANMHELWLDPIDSERKITSKTKAIIVYHLAGYPGPSEEIRRICSRYNLKMIEDCNNGMFATISGLPIGSLGDYSVYSFYPNRQVTAIEGGAVVCKEESGVVQARRYRKFGMDLSSFREPNGQIRKDFNVNQIGYSASMSNVNAAVGIQSLKKAKDRYLKVIENATYLLSKLDNDGAFTPIKTVNSNPSYWALLGYVDNSDGFVEYMKLNGIQCSSLHQRNDIYSCFNASKVDCAQLEKIESSLVAIPCGWWLSKKELEFIAKIISQYYV